MVVDATNGYVKLDSLPTGVTAVTTGYDSATGETSSSIAFEGTQADINTALQLLRANLQENPDMSISIDVQPGGKAYYSYNGHFYEFVEASGITWQDAKAAAAGKTFMGLHGYLATITSEGENNFAADKLAGDGWIGASDAVIEGIWKWVEGPEGEANAGGTQFWTGDTDAEASSTTNYGSALGGAYANWAATEPNNSDASNGGEDYAHFYGVGTNKGTWNDYFKVTRRPSAVIWSNTVG